MPFKVTVDRNLCCGSGLCWSTAPRFFDLDDDGIVILLRDSADESDLKLTAAAKSCPTGTIRLELE